mgnify:FL=1
MKISQFTLANFVFYSIIDKGGSKMKKICNLLIALVLLFVPIVCLADSDKKAADVYIFYGRGCPHCEEFFTWVKSLSSDEKSKFNLVKYETWYNTTNSNALAKVAEHFNDTDYGVPYIIIGNTRYSGFGDTNKDQILAAINDYYNLDERANLIEELNLEVVADAPEKVEKTKTAVVIVVVLAICVGASVLIYMVSKSEE